MSCINVSLIKQNDFSVIFSKVKLPNHSDAVTMGPGGRAPSHFPDAMGGH